ncbi:Uncharacterized protein HZ326_17164 [Fusarium oxysporum f. sp. albedinis]|nr:Uncharacterized protein HZ326_17164 [Fusarium oxysporum f. sp. albedinis]
MARMSFIQVVLCRGAAPKRCRSESSSAPGSKSLLSIGSAHHKLTKWWSSSPKRLFVKRKGIKRRLACSAVAGRMGTGKIKRRENVGGGGQQLCFYEWAGDEWE